MRARLTFLLALAFVAAWTASGAAEEAPGGPSPLWWTLTDEITPDELRAAHEDAELSRERYADAVAAGYAAPVPEASMRSIRLFYSGGLTPELVPMWQAFHGFAAPMRGESASRFQAKARYDLERYGFEAAAAEAIVAAALEFLDRAEGLRLALRDQQSGFMELLGQAAGHLDPEAYRRAVDSRDAGLLARSTGREPGLVAELMRAWERDPVQELAAAALPALRRQLGGADWERFRRFLLTENATWTSVIDITPNPSDGKETHE